MFLSISSVFIDLLLYKSIGKNLCKQIFYKRHTWSEGTEPPVPVL